MVDRQEVEALLTMAQSVAPADAVFGEERIGVEGSTLAALCRAWLALDSGLRVYVGRVYDCDVGEDRGEIIRTLPVDLIGHVRIVREVREHEQEKNNE